METPLKVYGNLECELKEKSSQYHQAESGSRLVTL